MRTSIKATLLIAALMGALSPAVAGRTATATATRTGAGATRPSSGPRVSAPRTPPSYAKLVQQRPKVAGFTTTPPSNVTRVVYEYGSSGLDFTDLAMLYWLLERDDISSSDKAWVQEQIKKNAKSDGESSNAPAQPKKLLAAARPAVEFMFEGIDDPHPVGKKTIVRVSARSQGQPAPLSCDHKDARQVAGGRVEISWVPDAPGVAVLTCKAGHRTERRLIRQS